MAVAMELGRRWGCVPSVKPTTRLRRRILLVLKWWRRYRPVRMEWWLCRWLLAELLWDWWHEVVGTSVALQDAVVWGKDGRWW